MTYKELQSALADQDAFIEAACQRKGDLIARYIEEHKPLDIKLYRRIIVRMRVTEERRETLRDPQLRMKKYQAGHVYTVMGRFNGWHVSKRGQVVPYIWGAADWSCLDELLTIELAKDQPCGSCDKCYNYEDGLCYLAMGKGDPKWGRKIEPGQSTCPDYEEIVPGGVWGNDLNDPDHHHYPNVTMMQDEKGHKKYRVYSLSWNYFTEYDESDFWRIYSKDGISFLYRRFFFG